MKNIHARIDRQLQKVSMYRIVTISLSLLWTAAFVFSFLDIIAFTAVELLVSALVLIAATIGSSYLLGLLVRATPHYESSFITALILFFLISPTMNASDLLQIAIVGIFASVSKYLVTYRQRHIFNPAAIAAAFAGLSGLVSISWWVASPAMSLVTAVLAGLILYKTRRIGMGILFTVLTGGGIVAVLLLEGFDVDAAVYALLAWPILFFAGFMLSEPLTLPARAKHTYIEAVIVALLFVQPLLMTGFAIPPAVALLGGNIYAFFVRSRQSLTLKYEGRRKLTPTTDEFIFSSHRPLSYEPGQCMEVALPHRGADIRGERRMFSMSSAPNEAQVTFGVKFYDPSSSYKRTLRTLSKGDVVHGVKIAGDFVAPRDKAQPLLYIAGGIGITPFISHLRAMKVAGDTRDVILVYAVSDLSEVAYLDVIQGISLKLYVVSPHGQEVDGGYERIVGSVIDESVLKYAVPDISSRYVYISGPPAMVAATKKLAVRQQACKVFADYFSGY